MKLLINFYANVSEGSVNDLIKFITIKLAQQNPEKPINEIILQISSSGGSSDHGLLAYNFLRQINISKTTIGMGNVDSAAVMMFCAGQRRIAAPSCRFVLHEAIATLNGQFNPTKLSEMAKLIQRITDDYSEVISKVTGKKKSIVNKEVHGGAVLSSEEAEKFGLVTDIIDGAYLKDTKDLDILLINNPVQSKLQQPNSQPQKSSEI
ncbi:MAG: ATP-dependent Clp protease proteolytic subunit [Candidatus Colwellbacteria bacterium]|nr:ATP-dependent Clp protease proteolytic subunit [Candidatus Colwellbacteria bacterium]